MKKSLVIIAAIIVASMMLMVGCTKETEGIDDVTESFPKDFWSISVGTHVVDYSISSATGGAIGKSMVKKYCEQSVELQFDGEGGYDLRFYMNSNKMSGLALEVGDKSFGFVEAVESTDERIIYEISLSVDEASDTINLATSIPKMNMDVKFSIVLDLVNARAIV